MFVSLNCSNVDGNVGSSASYLISVYAKYSSG